MLPHEYAVIGHSRAAWGRHLGTVAATIASASSAAGVAGFKLAQQLGLGEAGQVVMWPATAAVVFPLAHMAFNKWAWKWPGLSKLLDIPDLNGKWTCEGLTVSDDPPSPWSGTITVHQTWEKIKIHLRTATSRSESVSAALIHEPGVGHRLMYSYRNLPDMGEKMSPHVGFCELLFDERLGLAEGDYFNNKGRTTFGRMRLSKEPNNG